MEDHDVPDPGRKVVRTIAWSVACLCISGMVAFVAFAVQQQDLIPGAIYPVIFPMLVGAAVGVGSALVARGLGLPSAWLMLGVVVWAAGAVIGQDYFAFTRYRQAYAEMEDRNPRLELLRRAEGDLSPLTFHAFLQARVERNWIGWSLDAVLTIAAAAVGYAALSLRPAAPAVDTPGDAEAKVTA